MTRLAGLALAAALTVAGGTAHAGDTELPSALANCGVPPALMAITPAEARVSRH